jgi:hypothetical protein
MREVEKNLDKSIVSVLKSHCTKLKRQDQKTFHIILFVIIILPFSYRPCLQKSKPICINPVQVCCPGLA